MKSQEEFQDAADRAFELLEQKSPHQLAVELAHLQRKHAIAVSAVNKIGTQRDQLAAQLKDATAQCGMAADLLRELREGAEIHLHNCIVCKNEQGIANWTSKLERIDATLAGKLPEQHPDDAAVDRFAIAMKAKLATAREKGRGGWDDPSACSVDFLAELLVGHVSKGNPGNFEDIANLAMMLHQRGADPAVLAGKLPVPVVPEDWQLVPVEPTESMIGHGCGASVMVVSEVVTAWGAMLAAAPKP